MENSIYQMYRHMTICMITVYEDSQGLTVTNNDGRTEQK